MPKKDLNPLQSHHKAQKRAAIAKSRANATAQRIERLSTSTKGGSNTTSLQRKIETLKTLEEDLKARGRELSSKEKHILASLQRDVKLVEKIRNKNGAEGEHYPRNEKRSGYEKADKGGPRRLNNRDEGGDGESGNDTDPEVRTIPMPRDTPPPRPNVRKWKPKEVAEAVITYSSAPVLRDFNKESTLSKFAPTVVRRNIAKAKGITNEEGAGLLEEEEYERLERGGYIPKQTESTTATQKDGGNRVGERKMTVTVEDEDEMEEGV